MQIPIYAPATEIELLARRALRAEKIKDMVVLVSEANLIIQDLRSLVFGINFNQHPIVVYLVLLMKRLAYDPSKDNSLMASEASVIRLAKV